MAALAVGLVLSAVIGRPALAATPREQAEAEARRACAAGRVQEGIEMLAALLTEYGHPNYIYNQGRCYQQNGKPEPAIARFKEYLRAAPGISPQERTRVERFIRELEEEVQAAPEGGPPIEIPTAERAARASEPRPRLAPAGTVERPARPASRSRPLRTAGLALGAVGVAGLATGLVFSLKIRSMNREVETARRLEPRTLQMNEDRARGYETLQWVGYGVGGLALGGAIVCLILDAGAEPPKRRVSFTGTIDAQGRPGLALSGRF